MTEANPNHPVTRAVRNEWHKIAAFLLVKLNEGREVVLTLADIEAALARPGGINIVLHEKRDGLHIKLVGDDEAERLAREAGGLPE